MNVLRKIIMAGTLFALVTMPGGALANELIVKYSIVQSEVHEALVTGTMQVTVLNATDSELHNVDLRLEPPGFNHIQNGVYQFGTIPGGEVRVVVGDFVFLGESFSSGQPVIWRIDYDDALRDHHQIVVLGFEEVGVAQQ